MLFLGTDRPLQASAKKALNWPRRTWFFLDFVTLIPFDMIGLTSGTDSLKDLFWLQNLISGSGLSE